MPYKKYITIVALAAIPLLAAVPAHAQLGSPAFTATPGTVIRSADINGVFSDIYSRAVNREGGTLTGTLNARTIVPTADSTYDLGTTSVRWATGYFDALDVPALTLTTLTCTGCVTSTNVLDGTLLNADINASAAIAITKLATFTSAQLATQVTDETGSGAAVFATSPTLVTPVLGAATATTLNGYTFNQSVASGASPTLTGTNFTGIPESAITDGSILARLAANETVTGAWRFTPSGDAPIFDNTLRVYGLAGGGTATLIIAADATANTVDITRLQVLDGGGFRVTLNNGATTGLDMDVSGNTTVVGTWTFNTNLKTTGIVGASDSSTMRLSASTVAGFGGLVDLRGHTHATLPSSIALSAVGAAGVAITAPKTSMSGTLEWGGGSAISSSSNVATLDGTQTISGAKTFTNLLLAQRTTEQVRIGYDASNYYSTTVASNGAVTFNAVGSGAAFTFSDVVGSTGFGTHTFSAGGTGGNILNIRNTTAGTGNFSALYMGNDSGTSRGFIATYASTFGSAAYAIAEGTALVNTGTGGLSLAATNAAGNISFYSRNALALTLGASQAATFTGSISAPSGSTFTTNLKVLGAEGGAASLYLWADEGDDSADLSSIEMTTAGLLRFGIGIDLSVMYLSGSALTLDGGTDLVLTSGSTITAPSLASSSGTRYLCADTAGLFSSSASACSGTDADLIATIPYLLDELAALKTELAHLRQLR